MTDDLEAQTAAADAQITALQRQIDRTAGEYGLPPGLLNAAQTPADVEALAAELLAWKVATAPAPPKPATAAVSASRVSHYSSGGPLDGRIVGPPPIRTRDQASRMSPAALMAAWRAGMLEGIGGGPAKPARNQAPTQRT